MKLDNQLLERKRPKFSVAIQTDKYRSLVNNTLNDPKRASRFIAAVSSAVAVNPDLQLCDAGSVLTAALLGESLNLSPSPQLGHYYMVPYDVSVKDANGKALRDESGNCVKEKRAQFQIGYKGYIQLAIRSGQYRRLNTLAIKEGELVKFDQLTEDLEINLIADDDEREHTPTIGYYAMFEYHSGFRKAIYWSKKKMENHADQYSKAFSLKSYRALQEGKIPDREKWKYSSVWYTNFDAMAIKTMLRQLISKWGIMSIEMQTAMENDMAVFDKDGSSSFEDMDPGLPPLPPESDAPADPPKVTLDEL